MPKRLAVGKHLASSLRLAGRGGRPQVEPLEPRTLLTSTWFVAPWGNDASPGSQAGPFRTIQEAATVAGSGDVVEIRAGVYRETVRPVHSGVTFEAYNGESVTVTGLDEVSGWTAYAGDIYKAPMSWDLGEGDNQVFLDGKLVTEATWPNLGPDLSHPVKEIAPVINSGWGSATIYDPKLSAGWQGAGIYIMSGEGWYGQTGTVTASGAGWLTFSFRPDNSYLIPRGGNSYYLFGKFQALNSPGEWFRDATGQLYLWTPAGDNPASHVAEAKSRPFAFDVSGASNITLEGINIFGATIKTDAASTGFVMDQCNANYISRFTWQDVGWDQPWDSGIELNGAGSTVENSVIGFSAGDGVYVNADNCRVVNDVIHDVVYNAGDSAAVRDFGNFAVIDNNLIYNSGRMGINFRGWGTKIIGNSIHDVMIQTSDGGAIYTIRQNGAGSEIAFNTVWNVLAATPTQHRDWFAGVGIFLDDNSSNFNVHDNTVWNADEALKLNYSSRGNTIVANQLSGWIGSIVGSWNGDWTGTTIANNVLFNSIYATGWGDAMWGNRFASGFPQPHPSPAPPPAAGPPSYLSLLAAAASDQAASSVSAGVSAPAPQARHLARHPRRPGHATAGAPNLVVHVPQTRRVYRRTHPGSIVVRLNDTGGAVADEAVTIALLINTTAAWAPSLEPLTTVTIAKPRIGPGGSKTYRLTLPDLSGVLSAEPGSVSRRGPYYVIAVAQAGTTYDPSRPPSPSQVATSAHPFNVA